jgi:hypothetical protein
MKEEQLINNYGSTALCWALVAFQFDPLQSAGLPGRGISRLQGLYLHTE